MQTLQQIIQELQALSRSADVHGEQADFWVDVGSVDDNTAMALRGISEQEGSLAATEELKGRIDSLSERMAGLKDFADKKQHKALSTALTKIIEDAKQLQVDITSAVGKQKQAEKQEKKKEQGQEQAEQPEKEKPGQKGRSQSAQAQPAAKGFKPPQNEPAPGEKGQKESICIGGALITGLDDPFGLGEAFMEEVRLNAGIKPRRK